MTSNRSETTRGILITRIVVISVIAVSLAVLGSNFKKLLSVRAQYLEGKTAYSPVYLEPEIGPSLESTSLSRPLLPVVAIAWFSVSFVAGIGFVWGALWVRIKLHSGRGGLAVWILRRLQTFAQSNGRYPRLRAIMRPLPLLIFVGFASLLLHDSSAQFRRKQIECLQGVVISCPKPQESFTSQDSYQVIRLPRARESRGADIVFLSPRTPTATEIFVPPSLRALTGWLFVVAIIGALFAFGFSFAHLRPGPIIGIAPGSRHFQFVDFFYSAVTVEEVFKPIIADWRTEYFEALKQGRSIKARWICVRYTYRFIMAMGLRSIYSVLSAMVLLRK